MPRIYQNQHLALRSELCLDSDAAHHVKNVLRMQVGDAITVFNGEGGEYHGKIINIRKQQVQVLLETFHAQACESPLHIHLGQAISQREKMRFTLQKAVELGVSSITPLYTTRSEKKLAADKLNKRILHWQSIIISACEQCGRNLLPKLYPPLALATWLTQVSTQEDSTRIVLHPAASQSISEFTFSTQKIYALVGAESGLSTDEFAEAQAQQFTGIRLGPRILRTETASLALLAILQAKQGDF
jgi:16S rRNA (uracil1498-N3)-methyltransferase